MSICVVWYVVFLCDLILKSIYGELFVGNVFVVLLKSFYRFMIYLLCFNYFVIIKLCEVLGYEEFKVMKLS